MTVVKAYPDLHVKDVNVIQDAAVPVTPVTPHAEIPLAYSLIVARPFPAFKAVLVHAPQAFAAVL